MSAAPFWVDELADDVLPMVSAVLTVCRDTDTAQPVGMASAVVEPPASGNRPAKGGSLIDAYLRDYEARSQSNGDRYAGVYQRQRLFVRAEAILGCQLIDATPELMQSWWDTIAQTNGAEGLKGALGGLRAFFSWSIVRGHIDSDPTRFLVKPRVPKRRPRPISEADLALALSSAEATRVRPALALAAFAGLRAHEIAGLRRDDIGDGVILVTGKGSKDRAIDLHPMVTGALRPIIDLHPWLFPKRNNGRGHILAATLGTLCNEHLHGLGLPATLHKLRHRFATQLYLASHGDLLMVQNMLGHSSPTTTAVYADFDRTASAKAIRQLPAPPPRLVRF